MGSISQQSVKIVQRKFGRWPMVNLRHIWYMIISRIRTHRVKYYEMSPSAQMAAYLLQQAGLFSTQESQQYGMSRTAPRSLTLLMNTRYGWLSLAQMDTIWPLQVMTTPWVYGKYLAGAEWRH